MKPVALHDLKAVCQNGHVQMTWKYPAEAPDTVHIYAVKSHTKPMELDLNRHIAKYLRECSYGYSFKYGDISGNDVKKVEFCVYLAGHNESLPDIHLLSEVSECFVNVIVGTASVVYRLKNKPCGGGLMMTSIILQSSADIDPGILGYSYNFNGSEITVEFPGKINCGITRYPPIVLIDTADPLVKVVAGTTSDVSIRQGKISFWRSILVRLFNKGRY